MFLVLPVEPCWILILAHSTTHSTWHTRLWVPGGWVTNHSHPPNHSLNRPGMNTHSTNFSTTQPGMTTQPLTQPLNHSTWNEHSLNHSLKLEWPTTQPTWYDHSFNQPGMTTHWPIQPTWHDRSHTSPTTQPLGWTLNHSPNHLSLNVAWPHTIPLNHSLDHSFNY